MAILPLMKTLHLSFNEINTYLIGILLVWFELVFVKYAMGIWPYPGQNVIRQAAMSLVLSTI